jgi:hypothetical protein
MCQLYFLVLLGSLLGGLGGVANSGVDGGGYSGCEAVVVVAKVAEV